MKQFRKVMLFLEKKGVSKRTAALVLLLLVIATLYITQSEPEQKAAVLPTEANIPKKQEKTKSIEEKNAFMKASNAGTQISPLRDIFAAPLSKENSEKGNDGVKKTVSLPNRDMGVAQIPSGRTGAQAGVVTQNAGTQMYLSGVIIADSGTLAVINTSAGSKICAVGDKFGGYTVSKIYGSRVILMTDTGQALTLELLQKKVEKENINAEKDTGAGDTGQKTPADKPKNL